MSEKCHKCEAPPVLTASPSEDGWYTAEVRCTGCGEEFVACGSLYFGEHPAVLERQLQTLTDLVRNWNESQELKRSHE